MEIFPSVYIIDLALYFDSTLVIADAHIGYEGVLNRQGILIPRFQLEDMTARMNSILRKLAHRIIDRIIINGDLKHEFGAISEQEWRNTLRFLDLLAKHCKEIILIKGNHDTILGPIAKKRNLRVLDNVIINDKLIAHGDKTPSKELLKKISTIIIGHEHPAISIKEGSRIENYKCFLKGKFKSKNLIVQPSFNTIIEGTDVLRDEILSPFLQQNLGNFEVYAVADKIYKFGNLKSMK